jgi:hypothetical protein
LTDSFYRVETTLTAFRRDFRAARAAADRGETVTVKSANAVYIFARKTVERARPFANLEHLFGVVHRPQGGLTPHQIIRRRLEASRPG